MSINLLNNKNKESDHEISFYLQNTEGNFVNNFK